MIFSHVAVIPGPGRALYSYVERSHVAVVDEQRSVEPRPGGFGRLGTVAVFVGAVAAVIAGATLWLLLTDPVAVAIAVDGGEISPLVQQLAELLYNAFSALLSYL